ncbi:MAG: histidine kinase [Bacilli bacterium]|nr:histidine kinase [Bacilli bacterium]
MTDGWMARLKLKFLNLFYNISFKQRVRLTFIFLITLAIGVTGTISYLIAEKEIQNNAFQSSQDTVNKSAQIIDDKLKSTELSIRSMMLTDAYRLMMLDVQSNDLRGYYKHLSDLQPEFSQLSFNDSLIQSILIATPIGDFYSTNDYRVPSKSFYDSDMYERIKRSKQGLWVEGHTDPFFADGKRVISLVVEGISQDAQFETMKVYVVVNIKEKELAELTTHNLSRGNRDYFFMDTKGQDVIRTDGSMNIKLEKEAGFFRNMSETEGFFFYPFNNKSYLVNYKNLNSVKDWILVGVQSKEQLLQHVNDIKRTMLYVSFGFVLFSWFLSNKLVVLLLRPLFKLQGLMRKVEDNHLTVRFESKFKDEVSQVGFQFNQMLDEINRLIENVKYSEKEKRKAEMKALTAQMEPHFLYNTLNTIYCKSILGENNDVSEMILALSHMFQFGLSGGRELISLKDELFHVKQYCAIQQKCYENLFIYSIIIEDESLLSCNVPKILLQPLVENSIQHGFNNRTSGGAIIINISKENEMLHIVVKDNGIGMKIEQVEQGIVQSENSKKGYALRNIIHRLQLYYGTEARMEFDYAIEIGSKISLWIPILEGEAE